MIGSFSHPISERLKSPLATARFRWILCCLLALFGNSVFAKWSELPANSWLGKESFQNSEQKVSSHICACGMACKTRCCCAGKPSEDQEKTGEVIPFNLLTKSKADCGCQISPLGEEPVPFPNSESETSGVRLSQNACISIMHHQFGCQGGSKFIAAIELKADSVFETPPDPPPPNDCLNI